MKSSPQDVNFTNWQFFPPGIYLRGWRAAGTGSNDPWWSEPGRSQHPLCSQPPGCYGKKNRRNITSNAPEASVQPHPLSEFTTCIWLTASTTGQCLSVNELHFRSSSPLVLLADESGDLQARLGQLDQLDQLDQLSVGFYRSMATSAGLKLARAFIWTTIIIMTIIISCFPLTINCEATVDSAAQTVNTEMIDLNFLSFQ